jgi:hypothetical protein
MNWHNVEIFSIMILLPILSWSQEPKIGDISDGSRTTPVHLIKLIDQDSSVIWLDESPLMPFSTKNTCGACHDYGKISTGWHFNYGDSSAEAGRPGQPWIYADPYSATQIPLSLRDWPGTFKPVQLGLNNFTFLAIFGRHMPGGGVGDKEQFQSLDMYWRWQVSGDFEINCLSCHDAERAHDQSLHALQILRENFRWAATASSGFASVQGTAKGLSDTYDIYSGAIAGHEVNPPPQVSYQSKRFNSKGEVFFDITRRIPDDRCYFCHSTKIIKPGKSERWEYDEDVHVKAGIGCVDCHRHGLDHKMVRGYENPQAGIESSSPNSLACRGCHIGLNEDDSVPQSGRLGAPKPAHSGIPLVHFEKLACTTCHSGSWSGEETAAVKTSMAHALGLPKANKSDQALPHIISPVFAIGKDGKIAPHNLVWPSYWAEMQGDDVKPLQRHIFAPIAQRIIGYIDSLSTGNWPQLADSHMVQVLDSLKVSGLVSGRPVYVGGGKITFLDDNNKLTQQKHRAGEAYTWPLAHDVRPALQSLGVRGCDDCHSTNSDFYFGKIPVLSPLEMVRIGKQRMNEYLDQNMVAAWVFSFSFLFRPWLKYLILISSLLTAAILFLYGFRGLAKVISVVTTDNHVNEEER